MKINKWLMFVALYVSACAVSFNQFKVPPIMGVLAEEFKVSIPEVALLMTAFTIVGIILALPAGLLVGKIGIKPLGIGVLCCLAAGSLLGAFSTSFTMLLVSRILEGCANALILMLGIMLISNWFAPEKVGVPIGVFTTFPALAPLVMLNIGAPISAQFGWQSLWWGGAALAALAILLFAMLIQVPAAAPDAAPQGEKPPSILAGFSNGRAWLLAIAQGAVAVLLFTFLTIYPLIVEGRYGLPTLEANGIASTSGLFGIFVCILSGVLIQKTGKPALITAISFILLTVTVAFTFMLGDNTTVYIVHVLAVSLFTGLVIPAVLAIAPAIAKTPLQIGVTVALVNFVYYIGMAAGAPAVTAVVDASQGQWAPAVVPLVAAGLLGAVASLVFLALSRKKTA